MPDTNVLRTGGGGIQQQQNELSARLLVQDGTADACMAANEILRFLETMSQWPQGFRDHFERILKASPDGWKQTARVLVNYHSQQGPDRRMAGAPVALQEEVVQLLIKSDFRRVMLSQFGEGTVPHAGGDPWDALPEHWRKGPWSPLSYPSYLAYAAMLVWEAKPAFQESHILHEAAYATHEQLTKAADAGDIWGGWIPVVCRGLGAMYMVFILVKQLKSMGMWLFITYTILSWSLLIVRLLLACLAFVSEAAALGAEILRFPALVQNSVVVLVWWGVMVPFITLLKPPTERWQFVRWNLSFDLVNVHLLNMPAAAADFLASPRPPTLIDGWIVALLLFAYVIFYVLVLDRNQIHLYIPFTPRTHFCMLAYSLMCALNYGLLVGWGAVGEWSVFNHLDIDGAASGSK